MNYVSEPLETGKIQDCADKIIISLVFFFFNKQAPLSKWDPFVTYFLKLFKYSVRLIGFKFFYPFSFPTLINNSSESKSAVKSEKLSCLITGKLL